MRSITYRMLRSLILTNQFLTPSTNGNGKNDMIAVIKAVGGLQWGAEDLSLLSRLNYFESRWVREAVEKKELIEVHVLRGGLRIIPTEDYPNFFAGTREVIERIPDRRLIILEKMTDDHRHILHLLSKEGPLTRKEVRQKTNLPNCGKLINQLLVEGKVIRAGRRKNLILNDTCSPQPSFLQKRTSHTCGCFTTMMKFISHVAEGAENSSDLTGSTDSVQLQPFSRITESLGKW